jgi:ribulose-phosphate 3-epimerase
MTRRIQISPSLLSADFSALREDIETVSDADMLHFDVMDGHFVPNISIGIPVLQSVRRISEKTLDVHLMIERPELYFDVFIAAGSDILTFHLEAAPEADAAVFLRQIREKGALPGVSIRPQTSETAVFPLLDEAALILVMSVNPGFGGQGFMPEALPKIEALRRELDRRGLDCKIEVDGGVNRETAKLCREAGADILVAGSAVFGRPKNERNAELALLRGER